LRKHLGIRPRRIHHVLGIVQDYCLREKLPPFQYDVISLTPISVLVIAAGDSCGGISALGQLMSEICPLQAP
jgi:hypothetical protein